MILKSCAKIWSWWMKGNQIKTIPWKDHTNNEARQTQKKLLITFLLYSTVDGPETVSTNIEPFASSTSTHETSMLTVLLNTKLLLKIILLLTKLLFTKLLLTILTKLLYRNFCSLNSHSRSFNFRNFYLQNFYSGSFYSEKTELKNFWSTKLLLYSVHCTCIL